MIGFRIVNCLISEINIRYLSHSIAIHRSISSKFREGPLLSYFDKTIDNLKQVIAQNPANFTRAQEYLIEQTIECTLNCLNFDFFGSGIFVSNEDMGIVQIPSSWKTRIVDGLILDLMFHLYSILKAPLSTNVMEIISLLTSVRSSLFDTMPSRITYISKLITGLCTVLQNNIGSFLNASLLPTFILFLFFYFLIYFIF